jgi:prepilin-type N-terminal cleavage/methylation domain-containing protein
MNKRAFSLIELLVVVAIIGILAAIIVPNVRIYMERARITKTAALIGQLETAITLYENQLGKYPPSYNPQLLYIALNQEAKSPIDLSAEDVRLFSPDDDLDGHFWLNELDRENNIREATLQRAGVASVHLTAQIEENVIVDAWGNPIYYVSSDEYNPGRRTDFRSGRAKFNDDAACAFEMREGKRFRPFKPSTFQLFSFGPDQRTITPSTSNGGIGSMIATDKKDNDGDGYFDNEDQVRRGDPNSDDPDVIAEDDISNY